MVMFEYFYFVSVKNCILQTELYELFGLRHVYDEYLFLCLCLKLILIFEKFQN